MTDEERKNRADDFGTELTELIFEHFPGVQTYEKEDVLLALACIADILGCITAGLWLQMPEMFEHILKLIDEKIRASAKNVSELSINLRKQQERPN